MTTFAIAQMREIQMGPAIVEYLQRIDATLEPFGGRFLVHGGPYDKIEGAWTGDAIVIEFPDRQHARDWYASPAYRAILPLRTDHSRADIIFVDTVAPDHRASDVLDPS